MREVDDKLVVLARQLRCPILTNDYNLNRVAELQGVAVSERQRTGQRGEVGGAAGRIADREHYPGRARSRTGRWIPG